MIVLPSERRGRGYDSIESLRPAATLSDATCGGAVLAFVATNRSTTRRNPDRDRIARLRQRPITWGASEVRIGLSAGGNWIRTSGSARDSVRFSWSRCLASASSRRPDRHRRVAEHGEQSVPPFGLSRRPSLDSRSAFSTKSVPEGNGKIESISLQVAPLNKPPRRVERRFAASILSAAMDVLAQAEEARCQKSRADRSLLFWRYLPAFPLERPARQKSKWCAPARCARCCSSSRRL